MAVVYLQDWSDDVPPGTSALYGSVGHRAAQSDTWSFGTPYPIGGTSYKEIDLFQTVGIEIDESGVTLPSNGNLTYTFSTNTVTGSGLNSWSCR